MVQMYVDSREPEGIRRIATSIGFKQIALTYGDYASEGIIFERKEIGDLVNSIFARKGQPPRLFVQCERLFNHCKAYGKLSCLLVTGKISVAEAEFAKRHQKLNRFSIFGAIGSVMVRYDMYILWSEQPVEEWLQEIRKIAEKVEDGKLLLPKRKKLKEISRYRSVAIIARSLDVSAKVATELVRKHKTLYGVVYALKYKPEEILVLPGVGRRTFDKMRELAGIG